ncbi:MAG: DUF2341 domain-containing protein [Archangium sp.]|nr:DUF2341 domain-containing protein [Archangium sp.]
MKRVVGAALALFFGSCACEPPAIDQLRFACTTTDQCIEGHVCSEGECVRAELVADAGRDAGTSTDAGTDAGTPDSGTMDSGTPDAGASDAGSPDAGTPDSGTPDAGGTDSGMPDAGDWWDARFTHRRRLVIATTTAVDTGYAVRVTFDHAALVSANKSRTNGDDVRLVCREATWVERDRILDTGRAWNTNTSALWFRVPVGIAASSFNDRCYLYYGFATAGAPPTNRANVFLFFDDFESNSLNKWTRDTDGGQWAVSNTESHGGTYALSYPVESDEGHAIVANPALNVADVFVESWWYLDHDSMDLSQLVRVQPLGDNYQTNLEGSGGWDLARVLNGSWSEVEPNQRAPVSGTWMRVGLGIEGTRMRAFIDEVAVTPPGGSFDIGTDLASGNIGLSKWNVGVGGVVYFDDVTVRPWVESEPTVLVGPEE